MLGYTSPERVQGRTGKTFTQAQLDECELLIEAAEEFINERTSRVWLYDDTPVTETHAPYYSRAVRLRRSPVESVVSVTTNSGYAGATGTALEGTSYELRSSYKGLLLLPQNYMGREVTVEYIPVPKTVCDPRIALATTELVSFWMQPQLTGLGGVSGDIKSYSVGGDLAVVFRDASRELGIPDTIVSLLDSCRPKTLLFA